MSLDENTSNPESKIRLMRSYLMKAAIIFVCLYTAFNLSFANYPAVWHTLIEKATQLASTTFNMLFNDQTIIAPFGNGLLAEIQTNDASYIRVVIETLGIPIILAVLAAIVAWPASKRLKLTAICGFLAVACLMVILQICTLLLVDIYWVRQMDLAADWLVPLGVILVYLICFLVFVKASNRHPADTHS